MSIESKVEINDNGFDNLYIYFEGLATGLSAADYILKWALIGTRVRMEGVGDVKIVDKSSLESFTRAIISVAKVMFQVSDDDKLALEYELTRVS